MQESVARSRTVPTTKRKKQKRSKLRRFLFFTLLFLLLIGGGTAGAIYWKLNSAMDEITGNDPYKNGMGIDDPSYHADKPLSFVILGRDTRKETGSLNTDVMIVSVVNPKTKQVTMMSIPRDTRVKIPGYRGYHKINAVFANGEAERRQAEANGQVATENGVTLTKKTLEQVLGIPINHYVEVDFDGFKSVIDELGGVEVNVDRKLVYDDPTDNTHINLEPGLQTLNGEQALGYVRHRHDNRGTKYYSNDFDRNRRQQEVIKSVMDKLSSFEGFTKIFRVIEVASEHVHTDLSKDQIKGLAYDFKGISSSNIKTIENGAFWNASSGYTLLPREKRDEIRQVLRSEMNLTESYVAELNDSPFSGSVSEEVAEYASSPKKKRKSTERQETESYRPRKQAVESREPAEEQPNRSETPAAEEQQAPPEEPVSEPDTNEQNNTEPSDTDTTTPPPDIPIDPIPIEPQT